MVGASGAIAGVMGAYMVKFPHSRIVSLVTIIFFFTTMEIPAWLMLIYWFVIQFFSGVGIIGLSRQRLRAEAAASAVLSRTIGRLLYWRGGRGLIKH